MMSTIDILDPAFEGLVNRLTDATAGEEAPRAIAALLATAYYLAEGHTEHVLILRAGLIRLYQKTVTPPQAAA